MGALLAASGPAWAKDGPATRTITVRLAVDRAILDLTEWRFQAGSFLEGTAKTFQSKFGIKLEFGAPGRWLPAPGRRTLEEHLKEMAAKVPRDGCDIVVGIIDLDRVASGSPGIASYISACILIGNSPDTLAMKYAMLHEMCHVFGAIDLQEKGSAMSVREPRLEFDPFTTQAVLLHKERSFGTGTFPLSREALDPAIALYRGRAGLGLGEPEINVFLTLFYMEKNDLEAATQVCVEAAERDPDLASVQILLGNVCLGRGEPRKAVDHYARALKKQPADPALHFNLALAYTELRQYGQAAYAAQHRFDEAERAYLEALNHEPEDLNAHFGLGRMYLEEGDLRRAIFHLEQILSIDPGSDLGSRMISGAFRVKGMFPYYRRNSAK